MLGFNSYLLAKTLSNTTPAPRIGPPPAYGTASSSSSGASGGGGGGGGRSIVSSSGGGNGSRGAYYPPLRYESPSLLGIIIQHMPTCTSKLPTFLLTTSNSPLNTPSNTTSNILDLLLTPNPPSTTLPLTHPSVDMRTPFAPLQPHSNYIPRTTPKPDTDGKKTETAASTVIVPSYDPYTNNITTNYAGGGSDRSQYKSPSPSSSSSSSSSSGSAASTFGGSMFTHTTIANNNGRVPPAPSAPLHALAGNDFKTLSSITYHLSVTTSLTVSFFPA